MKKFLIFLAVMMTITLVVPNFVDAGRNDDCTWCYGSGECKYCDGDGYTMEYREDYNGDWNYQREDCYKCRGTGVCPYCEGSGKDTFGR